ncbi:MAG: RraA family protein [Bryobacteraceae bacterium]
MSAVAKLSAADFDRLRKLDTCTVSNAIERLKVRLRDEGFASSAVRCQFPQLGPMLGYAVTARVRSSQPPIKGRWYQERMDWWDYVAGMPEPRVMVVQDIDETPGFGAFMGAVHSAIALALGCVGCVTNGAVRNLNKVESMGLHLFAGGVTVSHGYAHIVDFGEPVEVGGLKISPGDLIQGDVHGIQTIPLSIAPQIPGVAETVLNQDREIVEFCRSPEFSLQGLSQVLKRLSDGGAGRESPQ